MREIKFRGQRVDNFQFVSGCLINYLANKNPRIVSAEFTSYDYAETNHEVIQETVGQYTGLNDKNGVGIYEGDIVRILYTDWGSKPESDPRALHDYLNDIANVAKVVFAYNSWKVSIYGDKYKEWYFDDIIPGKHGFIEVIGNIHENPELLK